MSRSAVSSAVSSAEVMQSSRSPQASLRAYGSWDSPIDAEFIARQVIGIEDVLVDESLGEIFHVEKRPTEKGRNALVETSTGRDILLPPWDAKTGVHTYGGSSVWSVNGVCLFSNASDSGLYTAPLAAGGGDHPVAVIPDNKAWRYAELSPHTTSSHLFVAVREDHTHPAPKDVVTTLVCINIEESTVTVVASGVDFYSNPCFSPDGQHVAWIQWNHPEMPWQSAELVVARVNSDGDSFIFADPVIVAGEHGKVVVQQPTWVNNHSLMFICDKLGWLHPWIYSLGVANASPILQAPVLEEFGEPMWSLGSSSYAILDQERSVWSTIRNGLSFLYILHLSSRQLTPISGDYVEIRRIRRVDNNSVVFIAKTATQPDFLVKLSFNQNQEPVFAILKETLDLQNSVSTEYISAGQPLQLRNPQGQIIHAVYYPPKNPEYEGLPLELPPCVLFIHGGPSARQGAGFDWIHQYYTSRGWAWVDVNYGGSTGFGRDYMERIYGLWGEVDINDSMNAVIELQRRGIVSKERVVVKGNSAGGFSVLRSLCALPTFYQGGISSYGISDLKRLAETTHKFQMHYMFKLQGGTPTEISDIYHERSPLYHADNIQVPLLMFQGNADVAVPVAQTETIVKTIKDRGGRVDYVLFEGEGHGWRKAATIKTALEKEMSFLKELFDLN